MIRKLVRYVSSMLLVFALPFLKGSLTRLSPHMRGHGAAFRRHGRDGVETRDGRADDGGKGNG